MGNVINGLVLRTRSGEGTRRGPEGDRVWILGNLSAEVPGGDRPDPFTFGQRDRGNGRVVREECDVRCCRCLFPFEVFDLYADDTLSR